MSRFASILLVLILPNLAMAEASADTTALAIEVTDTSNNMYWFQTTGQCFEVKVQDYGVDTPLSSSLTVAVSSDSGSLYSDSGCTASITSVTITAGSSSANAYFKAASSGTAELKAKASVQGMVLLSSGSATVVSFSRLGFNPNLLTQNTGTCGALKIEAQNSSGQAVDVDSAYSTVTVDLSTASSTGAFYSDSSCTSSIHSISLASGSSSATVYYKDTTAQDAALQATATAVMTAMVPDAQPGFEHFMASAMAMITASETPN